VGEAQALPSKDGFGSVEFERNEERASEENGGREGGWKVGGMGRGAREKRGVWQSVEPTASETPKDLVLVRVDQ
jgi:hypothetical protein